MTGQAVAAGSWFRTTSGRMAHYASSVSGDGQRFVRTRCNLPARRLETCHAPNEGQRRCLTCEKRRKP